MTACACQYCPNRKPDYSWDRVWRVIGQVRNGNIITPGTIVGLRAELDQMAQEQRQRVSDEVGDQLELLGVR